jgi:hypothetical protein
MAAGGLTPTPAAVATPNPGAEADAAQKIKSALMVLQEQLPKLQIGSPLHKACRNAIDTLSKHLPQGAQDQGLQNSALRDLALRQKQQAPMLAALMAKGQQQGGGAAAPPQPGGEPPEGE